MERKRRISAPFLRTGLNNYRQSKTAAQPENTIIALIQAGIADNIFSPIILRCPDAGRNDSRVVVLSHFMIDGVELLIVPVIVVEHCSRGIIWHQNTGYTTKVLIHVNVSGDPRTLLLVDESLYKWILAVCHNAHKEEGWNDLAGIWIDDLRRIPCPVNFDLFAGLSVDMHGCAALLLILLDVITELGIHERLIAGLAAFLQVLRPEEFLVDTVAVQLLLDVVEIRHPFLFGYL